MISGSLWIYYRDEVNDDVKENNDAGNFRISKNKTTTIKYFEYKSKIIGSAPAYHNRLDAEVVVRLKHLSNFKSHVLPLIKCKTKLELR